ncbi:MAG: NADP-dependent isocitrate dehydrogenase [Capsulimonadales bacterium]|nr:NADP-dependent isocitrate dehydrogenase [Capsulimonadales bacterium]
MREISRSVPVTVAKGDGIGPEIMDATLSVLTAADARLAIETVQVGKSVYERGHTSGMTPEVWESLRRTHVLLKGPITTPQGSGYKSLNVTIRKTLGLFANIRPCVAYAPFVRTRHPEMDVVILRENEEDLYAGIEHRQTDEVMQCLKLITRPGCEKIVRYAFEYVRTHRRRKLTCMSKDNIMKLTDGLFHQVFEEVGREYPEIEQEHRIIDIGAAQLADTPERFDVIVTGNLYGDIISDIAAQVAGSVGLAPSANIGEGDAMFEAIHGSAPDIAGQDIANPSGLLLAAVMMLVHIGQGDIAERIHNAWLTTIEDGIHTADIYDATRMSARKVGTREFADEVIRRLGKQPVQLTPVSYPSEAVAPPRISVETRPLARKELVGVDVFVHWRGGPPSELAALLNRIHSDAVKLEMITNRGVKVWPDGLPETFCTDHWRCRFKAKTPDGTIRHGDIVGILSKVHGVGLDFIKHESLCNFDGVPGYALGQGQ